MPPPTTSMSSTQGAVLLLEHAFRIHVVDPVSALLAGLHRAAHFNGADIVVQHVDPASCREAGVDYRSDVIGTGRVPGDRLADATLGLNDLLGLEAASRLMSA